MGSSETIVVNTVWSAWTTLPAETSRRSIRPSSGALMSVYSSSSSARVTAAFAPIDLGHRRQVFPPALVEDGGRDCAGAGEFFGAAELDFGEIDERRGGIQLRLGLRQSRNERTPVDGEQEIALLDEHAVLKVDGVKIAADPRSDLDFVDRGEAADEFVVLDDLADDRLGNGDHRRARLRHSLLCRQERS